MGVGPSVGECNWVWISFKRGFQVETIPQICNLERRGKSLAVGEDRKAYHALMPSMPSGLAPFWGMTWDQYL